MKRVINDARRHKCWRGIPLVIWKLSATASWVDEPAQRYGVRNRCIGRWYEESTDVCVLADRPMQPALSGEGEIPAIDPIH